MSKLFSQTVWPGIGVLSSSALGGSYYRSHKNLVCPHYGFYHAFLLAVDWSP